MQSANLETQRSQLEKVEIFIIYAYSVDYKCIIPI